MKQTPTQRRYVRLAGSVNRKAAGLGLEDRITADDLARIFAKSEGFCPYCGIEIDSMGCSFDHVDPFDLGGSNHVDNIVACCLTCQRSKGRKTVTDYDIARKLFTNCEICGKGFKPRWSDWRRGFGTTCSASCAGMKGRQIRTAMGRAAAS